MKVLLVATVQSHICQFHKPLVKMLHDHGCEVHVAARNNLAEKNGLKLDFAEQAFDVPFERSPFSKRNLTAYKQLKQIIDSGNYDVVHTNTPVGGILGRLAARKARKNGCKVLYTAHGFHFFQGGPKKSWLIYYPIEKFMCRYTDELITINEEDYLLAKKKFPVSVSRIHGIGANTGKYFPISEEEKAALRAELGFVKEQKLIICTGELNENKNQITAIKAMKQVSAAEPDAVLLLAGNGPTHDELKNAISELGLTEHAVLLGYHTDLERYVKASDLVISCSKREGLGLNLIEGMLCKKPIVAAINRGHRELVQDGINGYLVPATDADMLAEKTQWLLSDDQMRHTFGDRGFELSLQYTDVSVYSELTNIYRKSNIL